MENSHDDQEQKTSSESNEETGLEEEGGDSRRLSRVQEIYEAIRTGALEPRHQHDTPPPTVIGEGSLVIDLKDDFDDTVGGIGGTTPVKKRRRPRGSTNGNDHNAILFEYIRVLNGNGETLYWNDTAQDCEIYVRLTDGAEVKVYGGEYFIIEHGPSRRLVRSTASSDKPQGGKRQHRYRHLDLGNNQHSIEYVAVRSPTKPYEVNVLRLPGRDEFQIMLWPYSLYLP
jgi:hypothetical protein